MCEEMNLHLLTEVFYRQSLWICEQQDYAIFLMKEVLI
jgi:hypothetical protein